MRLIPILVVLVFVQINVSNNKIMGQTVYRGARSSVFATTSSPDIPYNSFFAGQKIGFDRIDMYERLDREVMSMIYGQSMTLLTIKRANRYFPMMIPILKANGVPTDFVYLAAIESYLDWRAYSPADAAGIWQFIPSTGRQFGLEINEEVDERYDPERATVAAAKFLKNAYSKYGYWPTVAASYNAGTAKISNELTRQQVRTAFDLYLTEETSRYVFRIMAMKMIIENPKRFGYHISRRQLYQPIKCRIVNVSGSVSSWSEWAKANGITYSQLREENPWIRATGLTNKSGKTYSVRVPLHSELYRSHRSYTVYNRNWAVD